ncbi:TetR family transcriptional regulator [Kribbella turkmenica]|uniref:TetR family transcriptional regulator n=1 Tax=Kribbella turkmenica TaxID=2530375 RepID=A0A4R4X9M0_9ACTN|nr:TetR/AcrR family transcriptional regulator [Kribbella turkmenica]TDD27145.1 TetR family transcriptional regulator [Kribbella turkmenica]
MDEHRLTAKGRATRERILAAAADLVLRQGVAGVQLDDVRRAAGVSGSQLTHYFHDKRTLIDDVIAWQAATTLDREPLLDSLAAWRRWADHVVARQTARKFQGGCEFGSLAGQLAETSAETRAQLAEGYYRWLAQFRRSLHRMRAQGVLRADADPDSLAHMLLAAMQGGVLLSQTLRRPAPLRDSLNAALTQLESFAQ